MIQSLLLQVHCHPRFNGLTELTKNTEWNTSKAVSTPFDL